VSSHRTPGALTGPAPSLTATLTGWFSARDAVEAGSELADEFPLLSLVGAAGRSSRAQQRARDDALREFIRRATDRIWPMRLNFYKGARFANSFKWRLLERGVDADTANEATRRLLVQISLKQSGDGAEAGSASIARSSGASARSDSNNRARTGETAMTRSTGATMKGLLRLGEESFARGDYESTVLHYQHSLELKPHRADVIHSLGVALCKLGRYKEAEEHFRTVIGREPNHADAHGNLGAIHLSRGLYLDAENSLRRALKLKPGRLDHRSNLGLALVSVGRLKESRSHFEKVLRAAPRHAGALYGLGLVARAVGRFEEATSHFKRAIEIEPDMARAWSALAGVRRMSSTDADWLQGAETLASTLKAPAEEAGLRFAIGKYHDDLGEYAEAFASYERANELLKTISAPYAREMRTQFADDMIRTYTREALVRARQSASTSSRPVFIVGMARSGTSLAEQILASHPAIAGAGELEFWNSAMRKHEAEVCRGVPSESMRAKLAESYLRVLAEHSEDAARVVDKAPLNSDYLGVIYSVFPNARIIYMRRDPIDSCLSCYFQPFSAALNFTLDLQDLAHYYREHQRLLSHWRSVLPRESLLEVPYEELVGDQEQWTRRMLDFLGLEWSSRCLEFQRTQRPVLTSSYWQVRQPVYNDSVHRWRHYRKFIAPLLALRA